MVALLTIGFFSFFIFLFCMYLLARDDFLLIRKNITLERVFNITFLVGLLGLWVSRMVYVLLHPKVGYLNPMVFFLFTYFPGMSFGGLVGGVLLTLVVVCRKNKFPLGRMLDMFSLSFLVSLPVGIVVYSLVCLIMHQPVSWVFFISSLLYPVCFYFLYTQFNQNQFRDGTTTFLFLSLFSVLMLLSDSFAPGKKELLFWYREDILLFFLFCISIFFLFRNEKLVSFLLKKRRGA